MDGFWYILHIYSGHEKKVKLNIEQRARALRLDEEVRQVIVPIKEVVEIKNGKKRTFERPSYPGYLLVQTAHELRADAEHEASQQSWHLIQDTPSVMDIIAPLTEEEVQHILDLSTDEEKKPAAPMIEHVAGDKVRVIDGPFKDFPAEINAVDEGRQRLHLTISILGRSTPIELDHFQVEKI
jgi:transcriptional antiterminator NusG